MNNFMNNYFGVLNVDYCMYFLVLSVISGVTALITLLLLILGLLKIVKLKGSTSTIIGMLVNSLFSYLTNRILYSMCVNSLR